MKNKKRGKLFKGILVFLVIVSVLGVGLFFGYKYYLKDIINKDKEDVTLTDTTIVEEPEKTEEDYEIKMFMVGDALIHDSVYKDAYVSSSKTYDFTPMLEYIKPISSQYDIAYYNQETILGGEELGYSNYPRFNSPSEVGDAFIDAGFNLVSLATNHTMDKGEAGVLNSVSYWKSKTNVVTSGQWASQEERDEVRTYEKNGITYAFFSYTIWTNGLETPEGKEYLNNVYSEEKAKKDIEAVRDKVDFVIVAMHWGTEYSTGVSASQDEIANYLSNLGVDLIIGSHPHVVEACEYLNDGKTFVIYSLGNFISDQVGSERLTGLMMEVTLKKHVDLEGNVTTSVVEPKAELIYTKSYYGKKRNFKVYPYSMLTTDLLSDYKSLETKYKKIVSTFYPELTWGLTYE